MTKDHVSTVDGVKAGLSPPGSVANPCPKCGKGGKEHRPKGAFICSSTACRHVWTKGEP